MSNKKGLDRMGKYNMVIARLLKVEGRLPTNLLLEARLEIR